MVAAAAVYGLFPSLYLEALNMSNMIAYLSFVCQEQQSHFTTSFSPEHFYLEKEHECGAKDGVQ